MTAPYRKTCKVCGQSKPPMGFARNSKNPDGLRDVCKRCNAKEAGVERSRTTVVSRGVKRTVRNRAAGHCELCGKASLLEVHHLKPVCLHPELANSVSNLKALCPECHRAEHAKPGMGHGDLARARESARPRHVGEVKF